MDAGRTGLDVEGVRFEDESMGRQVEPAANGFDPTLKVGTGFAQQAFIIFHPGFHKPTDLGAGVEPRSG
jgi:hypothetical protein